MKISLQLLAMNAGQKMLAGLTPTKSIFVLLAFIIFAMGFALTLVSTLKAQWGHQKGMRKSIISGALMLVIALLMVIVIG